MLLSAACLPPAGALESLNEVLDSGGRSPELTWAPATGLQIPIVSFGNVTGGDARKLTEALTAASREWGPPPRLRFGGSAALEWPGDQAVWVRLQGDVDAFSAIARSLPHVARRLGFLLDRRRFRPWMPVAEVTDRTTLPSLSRVVDTLDAYQGPWWTATHLSLLHTRWDSSKSSLAAGATYEVIDRIAVPDGAYATA